MKIRDFAKRKWPLSVVPTTEEVLRAFAFPQLPTIKLNNDPVASDQFERDDLVSALVFACRYNRILEAKVVELQGLVNPRLL